MYPRCRPHHPPRKNKRKPKGHKGCPTTPQLCRLTGVQDNRRYRGNTAQQGERKGSKPQFKRSILRNSFYLLKIEGPVENHSSNHGRKQKDTACHTKSSEMDIRANNDVIADPSRTKQHRTCDKKRSMDSPFSLLLAPSFGSHGRPGRGTKRVDHGKDRDEAQYPVGDDLA
jgi:hypothetical protein